jgi:hypothetical protein
MSIAHQVARLVFPIWELSRQHFSEAARRSTSESKMRVENAAGTR